jgi:hypothetical protein
MHELYEPRTIYDLCSVPKHMDEGVRKVGTTGPSLIRV